ncbi:hypothetical protein ACOR62_06790 [Neisseria lisongii]|nr:hypothetical protein [Neisseria lisongii]
MKSCPQVQKFDFQTALLYESAYSQSHKPIILWHNSARLGGEAV